MIFYCVHHEQQDNTNRPIYLPFLVPHYQTSTMHTLYTHPTLYTNLFIGETHKKKYTKIPTSQQTACLTYTPTNNTPPYLETTTPSQTDRYAHLNFHTVSICNQ